MPFTASNAQNSYNGWGDVMDAIIKTESRGNKNAYNSKGNCGGILQITPILVKECNAILKKKGVKKRYTVNDRYNVQKSKEMFVLYQDHFNPSHNVEKAIRMWNGGVNYSVNGTNRYYKKVIANYHNNKEKGTQ